MKLIIERVGDELFAYVESNEEHRRLEKKGDRSSIRKIEQKEAVDILDEECSLDHNEQLQDDFYMVFNLRSKFR